MTTLLEPTESTKQGHMTEVHKQAWYIWFGMSVGTLVMPRWAEPWRHTVVILCVCVCLAPVSLQRLKD